MLLRDELLEREAFDTRLEAKVLNELCRQHYNTIRPHSALGLRPPAPEALRLSVVAAAAPPQPHRTGLLEGQNSNLKTGVIHEGRSASNTL